MVRRLQIQDRSLSSREVLLPRCATAARSAASTSGCQPSSHTRASLQGAKNANCSALMRSASGSVGSALLRIASRTFGAYWEPCRSGGDETDGGHQLRPVGGEHARHAVAEGMTDDECGALLLLLDDGRHVRRIVVQIDAGQRRHALPNSTRLRPHHAVAGVHKLIGNRVEIERATAERRQEDDHRPVALRQYLDASVAILIRDDGTARCQSTGGERNIFNR